MWQTPGGDSATHSSAKYLCLCKTEHLLGEMSQNSNKIQTSAEVYQELHTRKTNLAWLMEL